MALGCGKLFLEKASTTSAVHLTMVRARFLQTRSESRQHFTLRHDKVGSRALKNYWLMTPRLRLVTSMAAFRCITQLSHPSMLLMLCGCLGSAGRQLLDGAVGAGCPIRFAREKRPRAGRRDKRNTFGSAASAMPSASESGSRSG